MHLCDTNKNYIGQSRKNTPAAPSCITAYHIRSWFQSLDPEKRNGHDYDYDFVAYCAVICEARHCAYVHTPHFGGGMVQVGV